MTQKKKIVVLTGAGISAESGLKTFRDMGGLWENYRVEDVASPEGWRADPEKVLQFYNERRAQAFKAEPNMAHKVLAELEVDFDVHIITQNVDNLHQRAGSTQILHLHGELTKVRSVKNENLIYEIGEKPVYLGDLAEDGAQLRPHIVWFGEMVPAIEEAAEICMQADAFIVIGTGLQVYPAAGLLSYVGENIPIFLVDPHKPDSYHPGGEMVFIQKTATQGMPEVAQTLKKMFL